MLSKYFEIGMYVSVRVCMYVSVRLPGLHAQFSISCHEAVDLAGPAKSGIFFKVVAYDYNWWLLPSREVFRSGTWSVYCK